MTEWNKSIKIVLSNKNLPAILLNNRRPFIPIIICYTLDLKETELNRIRELVVLNKLTVKIMKFKISGLMEIEKNISLLIILSKKFILYISSNISDIWWIT